MQVSLFPTQGLTMKCILLSLYDQNHRLHHSIMWTQEYYNSDFAYVLDESEYVHFAQIRRHIFAWLCPNIWTYLHTNKDEL